MAILTSLFSGISGLNSFGQGLSVVSNNIANMNTVGFKDSTVSFADIISENLGVGGGGQVGRGVFVDSIQTQFSQGSFETTGNVLDLALEGEGFFIVKDPAGSEFYTRAGIFGIDESGFIENPSGSRLQGTLFNINGTNTGQVGDIDLGTSNIPAVATTQVDFVANLDSRVPIPLAFDVNNPTSTSNFSTSITLFDSLGSGHQVGIYFRKSASAASGNTWQWFAVVDAANSAPIPPATTGVATIMANGTLGFGTDGTLQTESAVTYPLVGFDFSGGPTQNQIIGFDFGTSVVTDSGSGLDGVTQFGSQSASLNQTQNGSPDGSLQAISVGQEGIVTGLFSNGRSRTLAQIQIARFNNAQGLSKVGGNMFTITSSSGQPIKGNPDSAGRGRILANSLELSNVDLAEQFVKMIEFQRGFQANSRVITTTDDILQELVNLRR